MRKHYQWQIGEPPPQLGAHSRAKHEIIEAYLRRYIEICTATPVQERLNLTIVDGFCGGGLYQHGGEFVEGSPLLLLRTVAEMQDRLNRIRPKGFEIVTDFVFIDDRRDHTDFLRAEIEASPFAEALDRTIHIFTGKFEEMNDHAIAIAKRRSPQRGRSLFLLDQYGWSAVTFASVKRILTTLPKAEVFLTFAVDALIDYLSERSGSRSTFERIGLDGGLVRELLAIKDENHGWRTIIQNTLYDRLRRETGAEFYSPFFIRSGQARRTYWFVHLSRHREARNEIGRIHWQHHNNSLHHGRAGLDALGFTGQADPEQMVFGYDFDNVARLHSWETLREEIPRFINATDGADAAPTLEELFGTRCNDTPVTRDLFEEVLIDLRDLGELRIEDSFGVDKPRAHKVNWSDRIVLSQQPSFFGPFGPLDREP